MPAIVDCLNQMRPELPQAVEDPAAVGNVVVFHTNEWKGNRRKGAHWAADLPETEARLYFQEVVKRLTEAGWNFSSGVSKILMLTHNAIATEQGYRQLLDSFEYRDSAIKKEDPHILFLMDTVEPVCRAFVNKRYGEMFAVFGERTQVVRSHADKTAWSEHIVALIKLTERGTIGEVIDYIRQGQRFPLPEAIERKERVLEKRGAPLNPESPDDIERLRMMRAVPYKQLVALKHFIEEETPFSTKHGVKGAEFENVLVVFGRGWSQYNFGKFLENAGQSVSDTERESYERNRNLFYVACSRSKKQLALFFTQELTRGALKTLEKWFASGPIYFLPNL
jgi:DNA helicase-2/ATP-dependent DNA helicase PcrA